MDSTLQVENGHTNALLAIVFAVISWLTPQSVDLLVKVASGLAAVATAIMAVRYYYWATKDAKKKVIGRKKHE